MESTMENITEMESEIVEQGTSKEIETEEQSQGNITETDKQIETEERSQDNIMETDKQIMTEEQSQDNVVETENTNPGEIVGEEDPVSENKDSPSPMVTEEGTSHASPLEKETNDDDLPKIDEEKTHDEKDSQLESSTHLSLSPSVAIDPEEGLIKPTVEDTVEQIIGSSEASSGILKSDSDSVMVDKDTAVVHEETTTIPSSKLTEDKGSPHHHLNTEMEQEKPAEEHDMTSSGDHNEITVVPDTKISEDKGSPLHHVDTVMEQEKPAEEHDVTSSEDHNEITVAPDTKISEGKGSPLHHANTVMEQDEAAEEHDMISSGDHNKFPVDTDTKVVEENRTDTKVVEENNTGTKVIEENNERIDEAEGSNMNLADHGSEPVDQAQEITMEVEKGSEVPGSENVSNLDDKPSEPLIETSVNVEKEPDMPATENLTDNDQNSDVLASGVSGDSDKGLSLLPATQISSDQNEGVATLEAGPMEDIELDVPDSKLVTDASIDSPNNNDASVEAPNAEKKDYSIVSVPEGSDADNESGSVRREHGPPCVVSSDTKSEVGVSGGLNNGVHKTGQPAPGFDGPMSANLAPPSFDGTRRANRAPPSFDGTMSANQAPPGFDGTMSAKRSFLLDDSSDGNESGTEEDQSAFMKELDHFFRERNMDFKPPKFYGEGLNCLKLWRAVTRLGGYDKVTGCKLWRQVGESFRPPKTCTTVSWTFRGFYEKALLEYERQKVIEGELQIPLAIEPEPMNIDTQASGSGRARRDAAARAMQGWHSQRLNGNGEVNDPAVKDKNLVLHQKRERPIGTTPGLLKRKRPSSEHVGKHAIQVSKPMLDVTVVDVGPPADWVKINVQRTQDCFEVYALVPGLVREEVRVQSDPAGRLVISGEPENPMNPWGATPFKKVVSLPTRIDPHHTSAVVTLNGQLFVRVPLEQSD